MLKIEFNYKTSKYYGEKEREGDQLFTWFHRMKDEHQWEKTEEWRWIRLDSNGTIFICLPIVVYIYC